MSALGHKQSFSIMSGDRLVSSLLQPLGGGFLGGHDLNAFEYLLLPKAVIQTPEKWRI
jgi:hypothetical protein